MNEISTGVSRQDDFTDRIVLLFIRKILEQLDSINVLISVCSFKQAEVILRPLIENIVSFEFILQHDTKKRAAAYYLEHNYQELELAKECFNENAKLGKMLRQNIDQNELEENREKIQLKKEAFERIIKSNSIFYEMDDKRSEKLEQKRKKARTRKVYIQWYEVCSNVTNFYGLMKATGYEEYYKGIYGGLSNEIHALNTTIEMNVTTDGATLKFVRNPEGGDDVFSITCAFALSALQAVYKYLNDGEGEKKDFKDFYMSYNTKRNIVSINLQKIRG